MQVGFGGDAGADVEELRDAFVREVAGGTAHEIPVHPRREHGGRPLLLHFLAGQSVGFVIVLPAEEVVVDTGGVGLVQPQLRRWVVGH